MTVWCEDHKQPDCSHELTKLVDELAAENDQLQFERDTARRLATYTAKRYVGLLEQLVPISAENARLTEQVRIATEALELIAATHPSGERYPGACGTTAHDALIQMSVVE